MMHLHRLLSLVLALCTAGTVLAQFTDGLDDGNFTEAPPWSGDVGLFTVVDEGGNFRLRSNSAGAATYHLSTPSAQALDAQWEFFVDLRFATSGSNLVDVYLMSPQANLNPRPEGYFVRIGDTPDHIALYRRVGTTNTALVQSPNGTVGSSTSNPFRIRVTRDLDNTWTLSYQPGGSGPFITAGTAVDNTFSSCTHFGILIVQSSAAGPVNNHLFDNFVVGNIPVDEAPPAIQGITVVNAQQVDVLFDEPLDPLSAQVAVNYALAPAVGISEALWEGGNPSSVRLSFTAPLQNGTSYTLTVNNVQDLAGNATNNATGQFTYLVPDVPSFRDVVINELMADPTPVVGLPDAEYIELFNATTDKFFDLAGWRITTSSSSATLPSYPLPPGAHVVLVNNSRLPDFAGIANAVGYSLSNSALLNAGTTVSLLAPTNEVLDVVSYTTDWYQDPDKVDGGWSLEQVNPLVPCSGLPNWRASVSSTGGTPGGPNSVLQVMPDVAPPELLQVQVLSATSLRLLFSEGLEAASAASASYAIAPSVTVATVAPQPPFNQQVELVLGQALQEGVVYTMTVTGVMDCAGNMIGGDNSAQFFFFTPAVPAFRDVVINELMADPTPLVGLPDAEYIELFNATADKFFDLAGWRITTNNSSATLPSYQLPPGAYVVFVNNSRLPDFAGIANAAGYGLSNTALLNAGTTVSLLGPSNEAVDVVSYSTEWYQDPEKLDGGWSLEQVNPFVPCSGAPNWRASTASTGGSPGAANAVLQVTPDVAPPELLQVQVLSTTSLRLNFNEGLDGSSAASANYTISPPVQISSVSPQPPFNQQVQLVLGEALQEGVVYTMTVTGVVDCSGNMIGDGNSVEFLFFTPAVPSYRDVVINELMVDPSPVVGLPDAEYIELFNATTDKFFDLSGWRITTGSSSVTLPSYQLLPGDHVVFVNASQYPLFSAFEHVMPYNLSSTALVNAGTTLTLEGLGNIPVDIVAYDLTWYRDASKQDGGWSLEQIDPTDPCSGSFNWRASVAQQGGTPGAVNSVLDVSPDAIPPALVQVLPLAEDLLELVFSEGMNGASIGSASFTLDPFLPLQQVTGMPPVNQRVQVVLAQPMEPGTVYRIRVEGITDCSGNAIGGGNSALFALPEMALPGDVVINEVLPNPITTGGEYVEVYNRSNKVISLQGWRMANESGGVVANLRTITAEPILFFPGEYLLFTRNTTVTAAQFPLGRTDRFLRVDLPSYTNTSGTVVVVDGQGTTIDRFRYNEDLHLRLLRSVKGVSLERQDPDRPTEDPTNWHSAAAVVGYGTPGYRNSQFAPAPEPTGELTVEPAIFSPDNDGFQDVVTISYRFDSPSAVGTLGVFDVAGREVRRLLDNQILGVTGSVSWDGVIEGGGKGRIGPYVVMMEVFDLNGNVERFRRTITLAHQLD